jgi:hypothetical protein
MHGSVSKIPNKKSRRRCAEGFNSGLKGLKKILSASAIAIMSWQDVTRSFRGSEVKEWGTKYAHNFLFFQILFHNPKNCKLGDVKMFCYHS